MIETDPVDDLMKEIAYLREELKGFHAAMKFASDDTTRHIGYLYQCITSLNDRVVPLEGKLFPNVVAARVQLGLILENLKRGADGETDEKKD